MLLNPASNLDPLLRDSAINRQTKLALVRKQSEAVKATNRSSPYCSNLNRVLSLPTNSMPRSAAIGRPYLTCALKAPSLRLLRTHAVIKTPKVNALGFKPLSPALCLEVHLSKRACTCSPAFGSLDRTQACITECKQKY